MKFSIEQARYAAAYEADVLEAHLNPASFPKGPRRIAELQVQRLRQLALVQWPTYPDLSALPAGQTPSLALLQKAFAIEAELLAGHLEYASFPQRRREYAERQIQRLHQLAEGEWPAYTPRALDSSYSMLLHRLDSSPRTA